MFTFVFQPSTKRETLADFNSRLREYCAEFPVVSLDATALGGSLLIQGTTAEDNDADGIPTLTALVKTVDPNDSDVEEQLDGLIQQEMEKHDAAGEDGDPNLPVRFIMVPRDNRFWAVLLCVNGIAEDTGDDEGGDDGEPEPVAPPATPAFVG